MTDIRYPYQGGVTSTDDEGLVIDPITGQLTLVLDGTSLSKTSSGLKWNDASTQFIDVSSSTTAFRVTQRGTGAALLIEDSTNTDSTPFVIDSNGNVGIGTTAPDHAFQITSTNALGTTFDLMKLNYDVNWGLRLVQNYVGFGDIKYELKQTYSGITYDVLAFKGGNVGVGTTAPGSRISIYGGSSIGASYCTVAAPSNGLIVEGYVGCGTAFPSSSLHLGQVASSAEAATCLLDEKDTTPASPTSGTQVKMYMKADKIIFQYNDGGTVRYKYLDLTGTTDTWTASTTAP